jgi:hypothetical protein
MLTRHASQKRHPRYNGKFGEQRLYRAELGHRTELCSGMLAPISEARVTRIVMLTCVLQVNVQIKMPQGAHTGMCHLDW